MIPRTAARGPVPGLVIVPRSGGEDLPAWRPIAPRTGWSPEATARASVSYVEALDSRVPGATRRLVLDVHRDLMARLPGAVKRAELVARLSGIDHLAAHFTEPAEPTDNTDEGASYPWNYSKPENSSTIFQAPSWSAGSTPTDD